MAELCGLLRSWGWDNPDAVIVIALVMGIYAVYEWVEYRVKGARS